MNRIESIFNKNGTVMAERVQGILDGIKTQIKIQSTAAQPVDGRAFVIEDLDPESPMYGCMVFGTQGVQISKQRTADGRAWDWTTAMTASGIVADAIVAGLFVDALSGISFGCSAVFYVVAALLVRYFKSSAFLIVESLCAIIIIVC